MTKQTHLALILFVMLTGCSGTRPKLGINDGKLVPCPKTPNCVNSQVTEIRHSIQPLHYTGTLQDARKMLLEILSADKHATILVSQQTYIRVEFSSALFRFIDDGEFYFPERPDDEKVIHVRSAARLGYSDFGTNRKRLERIRKTFQNLHK